MSSVDPQLLERLKLILRRDLKLAPDAPIDQNTSFFSAQVDLDSLDMLLLVTSVEREFGVKIPNEAVGRTVFESVNTLARYIQEKGGTANRNVSTPPVDPLERLPHRDPFRFVSKVTGHKPGESAEGIWTVTGSEAFFAGHFPGNPLVPGVLIAEALAQISGLAGATSNVSDSGKLAHVDIRFEQPVTPPADIVLKSKLTRSLPPLQHFDVSAEVNQQVVARGSLTLLRS